MSGSVASRREFLGQAGRLAVAAGTAGALYTWSAGVRPAAALGRRPVSMAMHVHASFSEGRASMESQLAEAERTGVEVLWWTEHDWRMSAYRYRQAVHFDGLSEDEPNGGTWVWSPTSSGDLRSGGGGIVASPASPLDPHDPGALRVAATSAGAAWATSGFGVRMGGSDNARTSLAGQSLELEVFPERVGADGYVALEIQSSDRPARAGHPRGTYRLSYRFGGPGTPGGRERDGTLGIVTVPVTPGRWNSVVLRPAADMTAIWDGVDGRDAVLFDIEIVAASRREAPAEGFVDYLRFKRSLSGDQPLGVQRDLMSGYAPQFPAVTQHAGLEVSELTPHLNWFGGDISLPDYDAIGPLKRSEVGVMVDMIHAAGGLASYNHPFGVNDRAPRSAADQTALRRKTATRLIRTRAEGCDLIEVGYRMRGGVTLANHVALLDALARNGVFVTASGVSDNHGGEPWDQQRWNFLTWAWAQGTGQAGLLRALRRGEVFFADQAFRGAVDLTVDGACPMGSVSVSTDSTRRLTVLATDVPAGGAVQVIQGRVDYAGPNNPDPMNSVQTLPRSNFAIGSHSLTVDNTTSSYVRVVVLDDRGAEMALSNPVWLLRQQPPDRIPRARRC